MGYPGHLSGQHWVNVHRGKCPLPIFNEISFFPIELYNTSSDLSDALLRLCC